MTWAPGLLACPSLAWHGDHMPVSAWLGFGLLSGYQGAQPVIDGLEESKQLACGVDRVSLDVPPGRCRLSQ